MDFVDIFSGIGTIRMGMEKAGHKCVYSIEYDIWKRRIYSIIFGSEPDGGDINDISANEIRNSDIWCFGFPCNDIAIENRKQLGLQGDRSGLLYKVVQLIKEKQNKPRYLFIENVARLLTIHEGWDFYELLYMLDEMGYDAEWSIINSNQLVPQDRKRIYIIGRLRGTSTREIFPITESSKTDIGKEKRKISTSGTVKPGWGSKQNSTTIIEIQPNRWREFTATEAWRLQGIPEEIITKVKNNLHSQGYSISTINREMYNGAGDGCTVPVIEKIALGL